MVDHSLPSISSNKTPLAFVTEGEIEQIVGIACIIQCFSSSTRSEPFDHPIWIVVPSSARERVETWFSARFPNIKFTFVRADTWGGDKYYIQIGLSKVFESLQGNEAVICLDYDHIVLKSWEFPFPVPAVGIQVSSEVSQELSGQLIKAQTEKMYEGIPQNHFNASLLYGAVAELAKVGHHWYQSYEDLKPLVSARHRVEIAFSLAAQRAGVDVSPCDTAIQGNFSNPARECCIFHYGGESNEAKRLKNKLLVEANRFIDGRLENSELVKINNSLAEELFRII